MLHTRTEVCILILLSIPVFRRELRSHEPAEQVLDDQSITVFLKLLPEAWIIAIVWHLINKNRTFEIQRKTRQISVRRAVLFSALGECLLTLTQFTDTPVILALCMSQVFYSHAIRAVHVDNWLFDFSSSAFNEIENTDMGSIASTPGISTKSLSIGAIALSIASHLLPPDYRIYEDHMVSAAWLLLSTSWVLTIYSEKVSYLNAATGERMIEQQQLRDSQNFIVFWGAILKLLYVSTIITQKYTSLAVDPRNLIFFRLASVYISDYVLAMGLSS